MMSRLARLALLTLAVTSHPAFAQAPDAAADPDSAGEAISQAAPKRTSTGTCSIVRGDQIVDQQNCRAIADTADSGGAGFAKNITYVWPSGNRTVVGGTEEDFSVNGNLAVPLTDPGRGLCLKVEKTGNTFCYKEGAKVKAAAAPAQPKPAAASEAKGVTPGTAVAGAAMTAPAPIAAATPTLAEQLAEETKLRKAAEDEIKTLRAELVKLNEADEKRLAEIAEQNQSQERKAAEAKARAESGLKDLELARAECRQRSAPACERALSLAKEAAVTGTTDASLVGELQQLHALALAPLGIPALSFLSGVPASTWAAGSIAAFLALTLLVVTTRKRDDLVVSERHAPHPSLDAPPAPSLDPFSAALEPLPSDMPIATTARTTPPPIPPYAAMASHFPNQNG